MATQEGDATYEAFLDHVEQLNYLGDAGKVLAWDQRVTMPSAGTPARSKQNSALMRVRHDFLTDEQLGDWLDELDGNVSEEKQAIVREVRRDHERAVRVPEDLVERITEAKTEGMEIWQEAKQEDDFSIFEDKLAELVELRKEYAAEIDPDRDPYEVLVEDYEPYLEIETIERVLGELRDELPGFVASLDTDETDLANPFAGQEFPESDQEELSRALLDLVGYDWDRGRLDTAPHPFSIGTQFDARVTTRFSPDEPLDAIGSTMHEFGHASYTLGLPQDQYGTPLGNSRNMTVHESQSRLWENHVGRTLPFWHQAAPLVEEHLGVEASPRECYEAANRIYDDNLIRVEADELTYHMHILVRFEIERDLIRGDLEASEVPAVWNDKMEEYLGIRPETDAEGCLQDIHWSEASFGYFPTYSLGSILSAQLFDAMEAELGSLDDAIEAGDFEPISDWLRENIHQQGQRYTTDELIERVTGEPLTASYFLSYARDKYGSLYDA